MPYTRVTFAFTLPSNKAEEARELLDKAIDELAINHVPVYEIDIKVEQVDAPESYD